MFGPDQLEDSARGMARNWMAALAVAIIMLPGVALSEPFRFIRIGDVDGFGFADTSQLVRAWPNRHDIPADSNGDGVLGEGEFMPDLNLDGGFAWHWHEGRVAGVDDRRAGGDVVVAIGLIDEERNGVDVAREPVQS